jgi:hypothetical protein
VEEMFVLIPCGRNFCFYSFYILQELERGRFKRGGIKKNPKLFECGLERGILYLG